MDYMVKLNYEMVDDLFNKELVDMWRRQLSEIKRLEEMGDAIQPFQKEDLDMCHNVRAACEELIRYCFTSDMAEEIISSKVNILDNEGENIE